jgi:hypothetical protein
MMQQTLTAQQTALTRQALLTQQTYLVLISDGQLALAVAAALQERLARDGHRTLALVPSWRGADPGVLGALGQAAWRAEPRPLVVAAWEDGLLGLLESLGLRAYVGVPENHDWRVLHFDGGGGAMLLPVATARDLVESVADCTPWDHFAAAGAADVPQAHASARKRGLAVAGPLARRIAVAGVAGPLLLGLPVAVAAAQAASASPAVQAAAPATASAGTAVVFLRSGAAGGIGHAGWGYYDPSTQTWTYGAVEGGASSGGVGDPFISPGQNNGAWNQSGSFSDMVTAMNGLGYTSAIELPTATANTAAAQAIVNAQAGQGYNMFNNNCATTTYNVLTAYGVTNMPYPSWSDISPNAWGADISRNLTSTSISVPAAAQNPGKYDPYAQPQTPPATRSLDPNDQQNDPSDVQQNQDPNDQQNDPGDLQQNQDPNDQADPNAQGQADPNAQGQADPNAQGQADPSTFGQDVVPAGSAGDPPQNTAINSPPSQDSASGVQDTNAQSQATTRSLNGAPSQDSTSGDQESGSGSEDSAGGAQYDSSASQPGGDAGQNPAASGAADSGSASQPGGDGAQDSAGSGAQNSAGSAQDSGSATQTNGDGAQESAGSGTQDSTPPGSTPSGGTGSTGEGTTGSTGGITGSTGGITGSTGGTSGSAGGGSTAGLATVTSDSSGGGNTGNSASYGGGTTGSPAYAYAGGGSSGS